jgi:hypothetical protein
MFTLLHCAKYILKIKRYSETETFTAIPNVLPYWQGLCHSQQLPIDL